MMNESRRIVSNFTKVPVNDDALNNGKPVIKYEQKVSVRNTAGGLQIIYYT